MLNKLIPICCYAQPKPEAEKSIFTYLFIFIQNMIKQQRIDYLLYFNALGKKLVQLGKKVLW